MALLADRAAEVYPSVDRDILMAGVLLHDIGKMEELSVTNHINYSDKGRLLGHITLGSEMLECAIREKPDFPEELAMRLKHMILSHHGNLEHGSPVLPMTVEAMLLHYLDNLDAQVRGVMTAIDKNGGEGNWTEYVKLLDRFVYRGHPAEMPDGGEE
jgi:3'-5' exoribonuclease